MGEGYEPGADWIEWGSGPSGWLYKYQLNGLQTEIYGFEPQFKIELKYFDFHGNASFIRGLNKENNNSLSYIPPDKIRFQIEKNISLFKNTLEFIFVQSQNRVGQFETPTDEYQLLNYSASYTIGKNGKTHKLILQINNILNQTYYNHLSKIKIIMPEPGLSANASYRVNF
jgi:iron complex outermembrane receptor protein